MCEQTKRVPFGMEHTSRADLTDLMSKNNFTTEAPLIFAMYLHAKKKRGPVLIEAVSDAGNLSTRQREVGLEEVFGLDPDDAYFAFEKGYAGYRKFAIGEEAARSDVVVINRKTMTDTSAFEVKLCVVPNSATAGREHDDQSCEIVIRPPSIEQLAFSIADTYGENGRVELQQLIVDHLGGDPQGYAWSDQEFMHKRMHLIRNAAKAIIQAKLDAQKPFAFTGIWRTRGQSGLLEDNCFDVFVWNNLAFLQLLLANEGTGRGQIARYERSLIWLIKVLYDYSIQNRVNFAKAHSEITFNSQSDKAGAFAGNITYKFLAGERLYHPLIMQKELTDIFPEESLDKMAPERRLDAALYYTARPYLLRQ